MKHRKTAWLSSVIIIAFVLWLSPTAGSACTFNCPTDIGCYGGCEVNGPTGCGDACWGGCGTYTCKLIGPGCDFSISSQCESGDPPPVFTAKSIAGASAQRDWAILQLPASQPATPGPGDSPDVQVIAASTADFSDAATEVLMDRYDELVPRRSNTRAKSALGESRHQYVLRLGRAASGRTATQLESDLVSRFPSFDAPLGTALFFRGATDGSGSIVRIEPLFSPYEDLAPELVTFLRDNLTVRSVQAPGVPVEFFGILGIGGLENEAWTALSGGVLSQNGQELVGPGTRHPERSR